MERDRIWRYHSTYRHWEEWAKGWWRRSRWGNRLWGVERWVFWGPWRAWLEKPQVGILDLDSVGIREWEARPCSIPTVWSRKGVRQGLERKRRCLFSLFQAFPAFHKPFRRWLPLLTTSPILFLSPRAFLCLWTFFWCTDRSHRCRIRDYNFMIRRCFQSGRKEVEEEMQSGRSDSCGIQCIGGVLEDIGLIGMWRLGRMVIFSIPFCMDRCIDRSNIIIAQLIQRSARKNTALTQTQTPDSPLGSKKQEISLINPNPSCTSSEREPKSIERQERDCDRDRIEWRNQHLFLLSKLILMTRKQSNSRK